MKRDGFDQASTLAAALMRQNGGRDPWNRRTVLILDEAAMVSTKHLATLLAKADSAGAKVILAGDEKQLASIERGGMFSVLKEQHGAAELHTVRRVKESDQQQAFNAMHRGDFRAALDVFDKRGAIRWNKTPEDSKAALVAQWAEDSASDPGKSRFVFAYTNAEVNELNQQIRAVRRVRGDLGDDHVLPTRDGPQSFATGDRIQFTANAATAARRNAGLFNGAAGIVRKIDGNRMTVALDTAKGAPPREIDFAIGPDSKAGEFDAIRHGYAGTIYKGQGKTLDQTYLLHSDSWRSTSSYVALSRHRETVTLFAAEKAAPWVMAAGGVAGLDDTQRASAEKSYAAWATAKPDLAAKYGFADYVGYVQRHWAEEKRLEPIDRLSRQMGRVEERRAASEFVEGARELDQARRRPPLSIVAGVVGDYLKLCYDPAKDWLRWVTEDLRHRAALRRDAAPSKPGRDDVYAKSADTTVENTERIRRDALHEVQSRVDAIRKRRRGSDGVPPRPRADHAGDDGLRPLRTSRGLTGEELAAAAAAARAAVRDRLAKSSRETLKPDVSPKKSSDIVHGQGAGRGHSR
jgi:ribosomal protein L21E